jgi:hypothetical protein
VVGVTAAEAAARRGIRSRSLAWLAVYPLLGGAALVGSVPRPGLRRSWGPGGWLGLALAVAGYPLGCALLGHRPTQAPPDPLALELAALAGAVAPAEELVWGWHVERRLGMATTAVLFAAKHVAIDGRWRRAGGLFLFWVGLGLVRRRSPILALGLHMTANGSGVVLGHITGRDSF